MDNPPSAKDIQDWLCTRLARLLGVEAGAIDPKEPFTSYGLSSLAAFQLAGELEDWLDVELPVTLAWDHPTAESLASYIAREVVSP